MTQRKIRIPRPESYSHWPEKPYQWMLEGLTRVMDVVPGPDANYLVALGLVCYTEIMGHEALKFRNLPHGSGHTKEAFDLFLGEYIGYKELLNEHDKVYDWFRCGLCHEFKIKSVDGGTETGAFQFFDGTDDEIQKVKQIANADPSKGIVIAAQGKRILLIEPYLHDFQKGVEKFLKESKQI